MSAYKIKSILNDSIVIEYKLDNGFTKELIVSVNKDWGKSRIEEEIAKQKALHDQMQIKANLEEYFSVGEELQFVDVASEKTADEINRAFEEEQKKIQEENKRLQAGQIPEYSDITPSVEEQLDAMYWMRQGDMAPIQKVDQKIAEMKAQLSPKE